MEKLFFLIIIFCVCHSCAQKRPFLIENHNGASLYKIKKIVEEESVYLIYAKKNDSIFKILSDKYYLNNSYCKTIKNKKYYYLDLRIIHPILGVGPINYLDITINYKGTSLILEEKSHYKIYKAENLKGLCIDDSKQD